MTDPAPLLRSLDLDPFWMPLTANLAFKQAPRLVVAAKDMYYTTADGRQVLDGLATLWCVNAGHCRPKIVEAIGRQAGTLDYASSYSLGHPLAFEAARRVVALAPDGFGHVFFTNSGSDAVDTALKIALAYHRLRGEATRTRFVGRERGFHGANFGGISVGGVPAYRKAFAAGLLPAVDHLRHTQDLAARAFVRGEAASGAELADELERRIIPLHDASNIAAVIVEPVAGAGGVLVPPRGYLARLREICDRHGILLIFDEVITGFGRMGTPFASQFFGVTPDLIVFAKGVTSGTVPMGGVLAKKSIYRTFAEAASGGVELFHGYTYSGHPLAAAAALATLDTYAEERLFDRAKELAAHFEDGVHALRGLPHVIDCRNLQLIGAVELEPRAGAPGARAMEVHVRAWDRGVFVRPIGDAIAFCPPLIAERKHLDTMFGVVADAIRAVA
jgi:beta-alanine--pyruvate transaminase